LGLLRLERQEQRQDLHCLAEAHVVGQAGTEPEPCKNSQPIDACLLIDAQPGLECTVFGRRRKVFGNVHSGEQRAPFRIGQFLVAEGQLDFEIEHSCGAELILWGVANRHADARPGTFLPPVGHSHQDPAFLEHGNVFEKPIGLAGRPGQRLIEVA